LLALGRPGDPNGAMWIYDSAGRQVTTSPIGSSAPADVKWSRDRSVVYVRTVNGRHYLANINGSVQDISAQVGDIQSIDWAGGRLPPG